jgi:hypothetical protein
MNCRHQWFTAGLAAFLVIGLRSGDVPHVISRSSISR